MSSHLRRRLVTAVLVLAMPMSMLPGCTTTTTTAKTKTSEPVVPSNTQRFKERTAMVCMVRDQPGDEAHAAAAAAAILLAAKLGVKLVQHLINTEAKRYEAKTTASRTVYLDRHITLPNPPLSFETKLTGRVDVLFVRMIEDPEGKSGLPRLTSAVIEQTAKNAAATLDGDSFTEAEIKKAIEDAADEKCALTFCGVARLSPRQGGASCEFQLLAYSYPALKAKAASGLRAYEKRDDRLILRLRGPGGLPASTGPFDVAHAFKVKPKAAYATEAGYTFESTFKKGSYAISPPIAVPGFRDFVVVAVLAESSNFKKMLERIAKEIGALDPEDWIDLD